MEKEIKNIRFRDIIEADLNPQSMKQADFNRLVESLKKDKTLTSSILVEEIRDGKYQCISGHHRIRAAIKAGIMESECIVLKNISKSTKLRLQLQHNDIHGEPDLSLVEELKKQITEEDIRLLSKSDITPIKELDIQYEEPLYSYTHICLMPESAKEFKQLLERLNTEESEKYILEKEDYKELTEYLTIAFKKGV